MALRPSLGLRRISSGTARNAADATRFLRKEFLQLRGNLEKVLKGIEDVTPEALKDGMQPIFDESQRLVPVDKGDLKASGFIEQGTFRGNPVVEIGYGKGNKPHYTVVVHEDLSSVHKSPTQAKFLQQPWKEQQDQIARRVARSIKRALGT